MRLIDQNLKKQKFSTSLIILACTLTYACNTDIQKNLEQNEKVYLDYTKEAIDSAYDQSFWAPNRQYIFSQLQTLRKLSMSKIGEPERIQYGGTSIEQLDLYSSKLVNAPVHIFIHGGAWRAGNGSGNTAYNARKFVESGMLYVAPDYQLATDANGSLYPMVDQLRNAVVWTYQNAVRFGGNPDRIYLSGHSAGGHLGGVLITTDWTEYGLPADVIKGAFLSSGMYDLYPVSLSSRNEYVQFTDKMVEDLSPIKHIAKIKTPVILAYGTQESPEFKRQSQAFAAALKKQSKEVELHVLEGFNHFEIIIALGNPYDVPGEIMIKHMNMD